MTKIIKLIYSASLIFDRCHMYKLLVLFLTYFSIGFCSISIPPKPAQWDEWTFDKKLYWRARHPDPRIPYDLLVDKLRVKEVLKDLVPTAKVLAATDDPETIAIENLPQNYVMKANNASARGLVVKDGIIIARRKKSSGFTPKVATTEILRSYADKWLKSPYSLRFDERQYDLVKPQIFFEELLENFVMDIELFCFYGKVELIKIAFYKDRFDVVILDLDWNVIKTNIKNKKIAKPVWIDKLLAFTEKLTQNIDHVRVDYYLLDNDIYFGEFTFTTALHLVPKSRQLEMGSYWIYPDEEMESFGQVEEILNNLERLDIISEDY